jgi:cytochrome P450
MTEATITRPVDSFLDPDTVECPFPMYERLLEEKPVYIDPISGFYIITRFEDARRALLSPQVFASGGVTEKLRDGVHPERAERMRDIYRRKGWLPGDSLGLQDEPVHSETRAIFDAAFRASRIRELDPLVRDEAYALVEAFADAGGAEVVSQYAIPLPLNIIGLQMGVERHELPQIKAWTEAWMRRLSLLQTEEQEVESIEAEIEAQHFFKKKFDALRAQPNNTLLSDLVNTPRSDGRTLTDAELCGHIMADTFVGGSETTTNAIAAGIRMLAEDPAKVRLLQSDPDTHVRPFLEEVLRLQSPVQVLYRLAVQDAEVAGVKIPKGSIVGICYAAANRDPRRFGCPADVDLTRSSPGAHLAFGAGLHTCLGAPLARRELHWAFTAFVERLDDIALPPGRNDFRHHPHAMLRALRELHVTFRRRDAVVA